MAYSHVRLDRCRRAVGAVEGRVEERARPGRPLLGAGLLLILLAVLLLASAN